MVRVRVRVRVRFRVSVRVRYLGHTDHSRLGGGVSEHACVADLG